MEENNEKEEIIYDNSAKKINVCGLLSFIFSMVALLIFGLPFSITAVILGIIGIVTFKPNTQKGRWMSITGVSVGAVEFVVMLLYMVMVFAK